MTDIDWGPCDPLTPLLWDGGCEEARKYRAAVQTLAERDTEIRQLRRECERRRRLIAGLVAKAGGMVALTDADAFAAVDLPVDVFGYMAAAVVVRIGERKDPVDTDALDAMLGDGAA